MSPNLPTAVRLAVTITTSPMSFLILRADLAMHQCDMSMLAYKAAMKRWLKREQQRLRDAAFDDGFF